VLYGSAISKRSFLIRAGEIIEQAIRAVVCCTALFRCWHDREVSLDRFYVC